MTDTAKGFIFSSSYAYAIILIQEKRDNNFTMTDTAKNFCSSLLQQLVPPAFLVFTSLKVKQFTCQ